MSYLNSVTLVGFVGADPEQRQAKGNGSKFTVLSVATQRSWKNADDEWSSKSESHRICVSGQTAAKGPKGSGITLGLREQAYFLCACLPAPELCSHRV